MSAAVRRLSGSLPHDELVPAVLERLDADGVVIIEQVWSQATIDRVNAEVGAALAVADPEMRHLNPAIGAFFAGTKNVTGLAAKSPTFAADVMIHPLYDAVCGAVLGPSCATWQLNLAHLLARGPGAQQQYIHRDEDVWNLVPAPHPELQLASIVALVDFTADNGATRIVPGSHRWPDRRRQPETDEIAVAEMPAGSAVVYLGSTLHGGGTNSTDDTWRVGVHLSFCLGWLRTEENNVLAVPPDVAATLPRRAQELLGYAVHDAIHTGGGYLGMVDLRDPVELLADGSLR